MKRKYRTEYRIADQKHRCSDPVESWDELQEILVEAEKKHPNRTYTVETRSAAYEDGNYYLRTDYRGKIMWTPWSLFNKLI